MRKIALPISMALVGGLFLVPQPARATTYSTITVSKTYVGTELIYGPCVNGRGSNADADLNGACFLLPTDHPGTLVSIDIEVEDVTGKAVAGRLELIRWDCYPGIGCGWVQEGTGLFCSSSAHKNISPSNTATHLEITLGSGFSSCPTENFGTTGEITVTFTYEVSP